MGKGWVGWVGWWGGVAEEQILQELVELFSKILTVVVWGVEVVLCIRSHGRKEHEDLWLVRSQCLVAGPILQSMWQEKRVCRWRWTQERPQKVFPAQELGLEGEGPDRVWSSGRIGR